MRWRDEIIYAIGVRLDADEFSIYERVSRYTLQIQLSLHKVG
jgi:hypothetical protein